MTVEARNYQSVLIGEYQRQKRRSLDDCAELESHVLDMIFSFPSPLKEEKLVHYIISRAKTGRAAAMQGYLN